MGGGCLCGATRFEITGAFEHFFLCHCSRCRKGTGSAHAANLFSSTAEIVWTGAAPRMFVLPGTRHARSFCETCGSPVPTQAPGLLVVPAGCLDDAPNIGPEVHILCGDRAGWDDDLHLLPRLDGLP